MLHKQGYRLAHRIRNTSCFCTAKWLGERATILCLYSRCLCGQNRQHIKTLIFESPWNFPLPRLCYKRMWSDRESYRHRERRHLTLTYTQTCSNLLVISVHRLEIHIVIICVTSFYSLIMRTRTVPRNILTTFPGRNCLLIGWVVIRVSAIHVRSFFRLQIIL
jgi:hypothetical protein